MALNKNVVALSGGIGGAKLALGLYRVLDPDRLTVVTNTADDFEHLGLYISPDTDTVMYTLAGVDNKALGWGREQETWSFMEALAELGGEDWFRLGDRDLATHVLRTLEMAKGRQKLGEITQALAERLGVRARIVPMCDAPVRTLVCTQGGKLSFQEYFVRDHCNHVVEGFEFEGAETATPNSNALNTMTDPDLAAIVICPSNPYISIDPILAVPGYRQALKDSAAPVVAVSPVIGGDSVKGPTAKIMRELGIPIDSTSISTHYDGLLDGVIVDPGDDISDKEAGVTVFRTRTLMETLDHKKTLALDVLEFAGQISRRVPPAS